MLLDNLRQSCFTGNWFARAGWLGESGLDLGNGHGRSFHILQNKSTRRSMIAFLVGFPRQAKEGKVHQPKRACRGAHTQVNKNSDFNAIYLEGAFWGKKPIFTILC